MNVWKEKLVEIALDEKLCRPDNDRLLEDIDAVKALLKKDDTQVHSTNTLYFFLFFNLFISFLRKKKCDAIDCLNRQPGPPYRMTSKSSAEICRKAPLRRREGNYLLIIINN